MNTFDPFDEALKGEGRMLPRYLKPDRPTEGAGRPPVAERIALPK